MASIATTVEPVQPSSALAGLEIVDCDSHFTEPPDLWSARAAASMKDRVPVQRTLEGRTDWYLGGAVWASVGGNTIRTGGEKVGGEGMLRTFDEIDPSAWDVAERLKLLDRVGVQAQILYPNAIGFSSNHIFAIDDERDRMEILKIYNDFLVDVQEQSNGRLYPQGILPVWDMDLTVDEMSRLLERGMRGFTFSDRPELLGLPELPEPFFDPMWDLLNESGAVASFHINSGRRREEVEAVRRSRDAQPVDPSIPRPVPTVASPAWRSFGPQRKGVVMSAQSYMSNVRIIANLCLSNLFDRYPRLAIVSAESGIGWIPFLLETLEYQFDELVTNAEEMTFQERRPSEYFHEHIFGTFWFESIVGRPKLLEEVGVKNVLVATDIPHPTCLYPNTRERLERALSGIDPDVCRRIVQDNAIELYNLQ